MTIIRDLAWSEISIQRPYDMEVLWDVLTHLASLSSRGPIIWEARCKAGQMHYFIGTPKRTLGRVKAVFGAHTNVQITEGSKTGNMEDVRKLHITRPVLSLNTELSSVMIRAALAAMTSAKEDEELTVQLTLGAAYAPSTTPNNMPDPNTSWLQALLGSVHNASAEQRKTAKTKADLFRFEAIVRIGCSGGHTKERLSNIISALRTLESAGAHIRTESETPRHMEMATLPWRMPLKLSVKEAACFMLLPVGDESLPGVPGLHPKLLLPPSWYSEPTNNNSDRTFALSLGSEQKRLSISPKDALEHTVLLGPTGVGKSTVLLNLILADIQAGRSVLVIDPKADLVRDVLEIVPENRKDEVVVIDPSDANPVGFNPLAYGQDPALTMDIILAVFQELFPQNMGIRSMDVLGGALLTLAQIKGANLLWLPTLLTDEGFRKNIISKINDPIALQPFWEHYEALRESERRTEIAPSLNKLRQLIYRPGLRSILGQSNPKFSFSELFSKRRIVLVPLNRGLIGAESAKLLGSLIVALTWSLALARVKTAPEKRHIVSIFIDELQDYIALPSSFGDALAQARGLGVAYTVAHQHRGQLPPDIKAGVDSNCRNKIIFNLNSDDAKAMSAQAPELESIDFMTLPRYGIYTSFQHDGRSTRWISGKTLPPPKPIRMAAELKAESMQRYGASAKETEAALIRIMKSDVVPPDSVIANTPIGRKKKP